MSIHKAYIAQQTYVLNPFQEIKSKFGKATGPDALSTMLRCDVNAFQIDNIRGFGNYVCFEDKLSIFIDDEISVLGRFFVQRALLGNPRGPAAAGRPRIP